MKKIFTVLFVVALVFCNQIQAKAQKGFKNIPSLPIDSTIIKGTLSNGLTYYIRHCGKPANRADYYIAQKVGAILENDDQNGLAHFLEHMCFNGTKNFPGKELLNYFESKGVKFGENINAYTALDKTLYHLSNVPTDPQIVDSALLVLHDWSNFVTLDPKEIDKERGVIMEEWRTRNSGMSRVMKKFNQYTLKDSKYAKRDIIGDTMVINYFKPETIKAYYKKWYRPDLQGIIVVGDINPKKIETKIKTMFADIQKPVNPAKRTYFPVPNNAKPIVGVITDKEMQYNLIQLEYRFDPMPDQLKLTGMGYSVSVMESVINIAIRNRFLELSSKPGSPFTQISGGFSSETRTKDKLAFNFIPIAGQEEQARKLFLSEIEKIYRFGFTNAEIDLAKKLIKQGVDRQYKQRATRTNKSIAEECSRNFLDAEPMPGITLEKKMTNMILPKITSQSLSALLKQLIKKNVVFIVMGPEGKEYTYPSKDTLLSELNAMSTLNLVQNKENDKIKKLIPYKIKSGSIVKSEKNRKIGYTELTLSNGIKVLYMKTPAKDDHIMFNAWSKGGESLVSTDKLMAAKLAPSLKNSQGLGNLTPMELQKNLTGKEVSLSSYISSYKEGLNGKSSATNFETLMQLIYLNFQKPRKDDALFNNNISRFKTILESAKINPDYAFQDSLSQILYNYNPRVPEMNNPSILTGITNDKILKIYSNRFANPADFTFAFAGNINKEKFLKYVEQYIASLKTTSVKESWKDCGIKMVNGKINRQIKKELQVPKVKNSICYHLPYKYNLKNSLTLRYLKEILTLRYTATIREEEGGSYGVYLGASLTDIPKDYLSLTMYFESNTEANEKLLGIISKELKKISSKGPDSKDFEKVRLNLLKKYKENQDNNNWWLSAIRLYNTDKINLLTEYSKTVNKITGKDISKMAKKIIASDNKVIITLEPKEKSKAAITTEK